MFDIPDKDRYRWADKAQELRDQYDKLANAFRANDFPAVVTSVVPISFMSTQLDDELNRWVESIREDLEAAKQTENPGRPVKDNPQA